MTKLRVFLATTMLCAQCAMAAIGPTCQWEVRTTGTATGGGGYTSGGTDYSQQDSPQLTVIDGVANGTTTITSVLGGFTAAMVGNVMYLSNIADRREIVAYVSTNEVTVDATVTTGVAITINVGGAMTLTNANVADVVAGNTLHLRSGTHTLSASITSAVVGTASDPIRWEGYNTTRGDRPNPFTGSDAPLVDTGAYTMSANDYTNIRYIRVTGTSDGPMRYEDYSVVYGVKVINTTGVAGRDALYSGRPYCNVSWVEAQTSAPTSGLAIFPGNYSHFSHLYLHDSAEGMNIPLYGSISHSIFDTITTGVSTTQWSHMLVNCTFYNCATAVDDNTTANYQLFDRCIFHSCTTAIDSDSDKDGTIVAIDSIFYNNGTDVINAQKDASCISSNPNLVDPANGNFAPEAGGAAQVDVTFGANTTSNGYIGAVTPAAAAGGSTTASGGLW